MNLPSLIHQPTQTMSGHTRYSTHNPPSSIRSSAYSQEYATHAPAPPPSPPVEDSSKCSLPSISTLLVYADGGQSGEQQSQSAQYQSQQARVTLPPTPPMRPDSVFDDNSPTSSTSPSSYYYPTPPQVHRNSFPPAQKPAVYSSDPAYSSQQQYYSPSQPAYGRQNSPLHSQLMVPVTVAPPTNSNPWHHHHHTAPSSHAAFPQSQDRYICQTCNKAFSRPSSLRIHSHSHTGEKPFKCPHHGCGKAFSVRSNMKRHERGCHQ